jgi:hypothetical protein
MKTIKSLKNKWGTMRLLIKPLTSRVRLYQNTLIAILFAGTVVQSGAQIYPLSAQDSSVQINVAGGVSDWMIDGVNQLNQQWFYYSVGSGPVYSIDTIASWSTPTISHGSAPTLTEMYANSTISVKTQYILQGQASGSGMATLGDAITINNPSATAQTYHFYQYSDFYLGGVSGGQYVQFNSNGAGTAYQVIQTGLTGATLTGTVTALSGGTSVSPEEQAGIYDGTQFGLGNGNPAPLLNNTLNAGPGNVVYAYEWDVTLAASGNPGSSLTISEIQAVVPEPSSVALVASGMLVLALLYRRRQGGQRNCHSF